MTVETTVSRRKSACRRDEGFTLVELLMALTLFMIVFAGVMTLMQSNVISSARANSRVKAVNIASSYIEQVRSMPYDAIGVPGGDPAGALGEQEFVQGGITFHIVPTVTWLNDANINGPGGVATPHDYKRVVITVTAEAASGSPLAPTSYALETIVSRQGGTTTSTPLPTVAFDSLSPPANSYISGTVHVGAIMGVTSPATILNLNMYADDSNKGLLGAGYDVAKWPPLSWTDTTFEWDTTALDASGTPLFPDGAHNLTLQVFDSLGKSAFVVRPVYIVNGPPSAPVVTLTGSSSTTLTGTWPTCFNNGIPAGRYEWKIEDQNNSTGNWQVQETPYTGFTTGTTITIPKPVRFDRYRLAVRSYSPTTPSNPTGFVSGWAYGYGTTRPVFTSVRWSNSYASKTWTSIVSSPTIDVTAYFPYTSSTVQYYRNSTMTTSTATAITFPNTFTTSQNNNKTAPSQFYYVAKVTIQPDPLKNILGEPTTPIVVWSNWVGPNGWVSGANTSAGTATFSGW